MDRMSTRIFPTLFAIFNIFYWYLPCSSQLTRTFCNETDAGGTIT